MRLAKITASLLVLSAASAASGMPVSTFLSKAAKLEEKGPLAVFSSDVGVLRKEVERSGVELRKERLAAVKAGKKPAYCPTQAAGELTADEILRAMRAIPLADRSNMSVKDALRLHMRRKFPCSA